MIRTVVVILTCLHDPLIVSAESEKGDHASLLQLRAEMELSPMEALPQGNQDCWNAGGDMPSRDASCDGDLVCARAGYDGRDFGDCGEHHCCSQNGAQGLPHGSQDCWAAGGDMASRDAACEDDLVCARAGYDGRDFGDCGEHHCCSAEVQATWHLAPPGHTVCESGTNAAQTQCETAVASLASAASATPGRSLQQGSGGSCNDGGWGNVPLGCSAQSGGDWAAHYKTSGVNCAADSYQLVCSGEAKTTTTTPLPTSTSATTTTPLPTSTSATTTTTMSWCNKKERKKCQKMIKKKGQKKGCKNKKCKKCRVLCSATLLEDSALEEGDYDEDDGDKNLETTQTEDKGDDDDDEDEDEDGEQ